MTLILPHSADIFRKNEIRSLEVISTRGFFYNDFGELAAALDSTYNRYRHVRTKFDFDFASDFDIDIEGDSHRIVLHAQVKGDYNLTTYSVGICGKENASELIRRFHFDYIHNNAGKKQKNPISHMQYGGKSGPEDKFKSNKIEDWLSEPRVFHPPINLALLLDLTFNEFYSEKTKKIVEDPDWRSLIRDNEVFVLENYYKVIGNHIKSVHHTKTNLVRDMCYGINN